MALSLSIESLAGWIELLFFRGREENKAMYRRAEWQVHSTLQLQRLAHETLGLGTWSRTTRTIPVTNPGELLGVIDTLDKKKPRFVYPATFDDQFMGHVPEDSNGKYYRRHSTSTSKESLSLPPKYNQF